MLTERVVRDAKPGPKLQILWDKQIRGLGLRITPKGVKAYILSYRINGRERRATLGRSSNISLKDARSKAAETLTGIREGIDPLEPKEENSEPTVKDGLDLFFNQYVPARIKIGRLKPKTVRDYRSQSGKYIEPVLGEIKINDVGQGDIKKILNVVMDHRTQYNRTLAFAQRLFNYFMEEGLRTSPNPCTHIDRAREEARDRVLSATEMNRLFKMLSGMEREHPAAVGAIRVAAQSGLRIGEILNFQWQHIDFDTGRLTIVDSKQGRRIHSLPEPVLEIISKQKKFRGCPWVFSTRGKAPITYKVVRARLSEAAKSAGIEDVRLHDFRRTAMTLLAASGASASTIQQFQGHASIEMAMRYVKTVNEPVHQARVDVAKIVQGMMDVEGGEEEGGFRTVEAARRKDQGQIQLIAEKE